jgi:hypothetical protein
VSTAIVACEVMREELLRAGPPASVSFTFLPMGLHVTPGRLRVALAAELARPRSVDRIVLGYGLCGNAAEGLVCPHAPLVLPLVHDCIPLLSGAGPGAHGTPARGAFYLSGGWMEGERTLAAEHARTANRFGAQKALRVLDRLLDGYERFVFLRTDHPRAAAREADARALAALTRLPLEAADADGGYLRELVHGPWDAARFVHVARGEPVRAEAFRPSLDAAVASPL